MKLGWYAPVHALLAFDASCPSCGSPRARPSHRGYDAAVARWLSLAPFRCQACRGVFALRVGPGARPLCWSRFFPRWSSACPQCRGPDLISEPGTRRRGILLVRQTFSCLGCGHRFRVTHYWKSLIDATAFVVTVAILGAVIGATFHLVEDLARRGSGIRPTQRR